MGLNPDHPGRFPVGAPRGEAGSFTPTTTTAAAAGGKGKGKGKEDVGVEEGDKMDVDPVEDESAAVPPTATEGGKRKPALKRKGSDKATNSGTNTPRGPDSATTGVTGAAQGVVVGVRTREERFRAVPRGELIRHLYKGLMWDEVEKHAQYGWSEVSSRRGENGGVSRETS